MFEGQTINTSISQDTYKTASTKEEQEKARKEYLDKKGIKESFRW